MGKEDFGSSRTHKSNNSRPSPILRVRTHGQREVATLQAAMRSHCLPPEVDNTNFAERMLHATRDRRSNRTNIQKRPLRMACSAGPRSSARAQRCERAIGE